jgi:hypothetical protein
MAMSTCPFCKETGLVEGTLQSTGAMYFRPSGVKFMTFRTADITVNSYMCRACGGIAIKGDTQKLALVQNPSGKEARTQPVGQR